MKKAILSVLLIITAIGSVWSGGKQEAPELKNEMETEIEVQELRPGKNSISYKVDGEKVAALLFIPEDYVAGEKKPAAVIQPPASGVKEQTAGIYAEALSKRGFIALAFDPRGFGESEGYELLLNAYRISDDIRRGISYLAALEQVDGDNLFNVGICAGAGFSAFETAYDSRIKAQAIISPFLTSKADQLAAVGNDTALVREHITPLAEAGDETFYSSGEEMVLPMVPETEEQADASNARPIIRGMMEYYLPGKPGDVPTWRNGLSIRSLPYVLSFSIYDHANMFSSIPVFMAYGDEAVSTPGALEFYEMLDGPKDKLEIKGAGHFDLYWMPEHIQLVADEIVKFFNSYL